MNAKNETRIASLLGTWTAQTHLKADLMDYELLAYFVIHFMPNPLRGYGCSLADSDCNEDQNQVCQMVEDSHHRLRPHCQSMVDNSLEWSDVNAFIYFGARVDVGFPFNKHTSQDTGGWVGPLDLIMAQNSSLSLQYNPQSNQNEQIVDQYFGRYVETASTSYLRMPEDCSLIREEDFRKMSGSEAVKETVKAQYSTENDGKDPFDKYLNTCDNGDVKPLLPLFTFDFVQNGVDNEESVEVKLKYKLLTVPRKKDYMYSIYPKIQSRFNNAELGFKISGPYCYEDDPHRGYSFDMEFDTRSPKKAIFLEHGCIEGLPCYPEAAELYMKSSGGAVVHPNELPDDSTTIRLGSLLLQLGILSTLLICIACLLRSNCKLRQRSLNEQAPNETDNDGFVLQEESDDDSSINEGETNNTQDIAHTELEGLEGDSATTPLLSGGNEKWDTDAV